MKPGTKVVRRGAADRGEYREAAGLLTGRRDV
jgi:hypothetical protein